MPGLEPLAPHRRPTLARGAMRRRYLAAALLTALLMAGGLGFLAWLQL